MRDGGKLFRGGELIQKNGKRLAGYITHAVCFEYHSV